MIKDFLATLAAQDENRGGALGRHSAMLASLVILLAALPVGHAMVGANARFPVLLAVVLTTAIFVNSHQRWLFVLALAMGIASISGIAYATYAGSDLVRVGSEILGLALLGFTTLVMFNSLLRAEEVSRDTVVGGICVYLLIGLCFALFFIVMVDLDPNAFLQNGEPLVLSHTDPSTHATTLLYFSFVSLTTLGYGDVTPVAEMARMVAVAEAIIGQLYLAVFVARLVALYVVSSQRESR